MTAPRLRLQDDHAHMEKFGKLCDLADELGISIEFYGGNTTPFVSFAGDNRQFSLEDIEDRTWFSCFPPTTEYKLTCDNPAYLAEQATLADERRRAREAREAVERAETEQRQQKEKERVERERERYERAELARLTAKYGAP